MAPSRSPLTRQSIVDAMTGLLGPHGFGCGQGFINTDVGDSAPIKQKEVLIIMGNLLIEKD